MGIKNFNKLLRDTCPTVFKKTALTEFKGMRIGIDANQFANTTMARAHGRVVDTTDVAVNDPNLSEILKLWYKFILEFIATYLMYSITPVFVFDGSYPSDKVATQEKRHQKRDSKKSELEELLIRVRSMDILERNPAMIAKLRTLMKLNFKKPNMSLLKGLLEGIGIPIIQARFEGEQLCSKLCIEGKISAVFSTDTDTLIHGAPYVITGYAETIDFVPHVTTILLQDVLNGLDLSYPQLVDLGIMAGCDYNNNIKGIGIKRSYDLIRTHGSIDHIPYDTTCLRHIRCRELFQYIGSSSLIIEGFLDVSTGALTSYGRDILTQYNMIDFMPRLVVLYRNLISPNHTYISCPPGKVILNIVH